MAIRFAFAFPDLYEVGMSHLGMKILYGLFNAQPDVWCERVFMPDRDMEALLRGGGDSPFRPGKPGCTGGFRFYRLYAAI